MFHLNKTLDSFKNFSLIPLLEKNKNLILNQLKLMNLDLYQFLILVVSSLF